jgi:tRNA(Ile2) C34 agmatinyltransferase TiaS
MCERKRNVIEHRFVLECEHNIFENHNRTGRFNALASRHLDGKSRHD